MRHLASPGLSQETASLEVWSGGFEEVTHLPGGERQACAPAALTPCVLPSPSGCQEIAEEFRAQEIDGQALLLLKEDHLMSAMNIKLGPALKIYARISMLKDS